MSCMDSDFFSGAPSKLSLTNPSVWRECAKNCSKRRYNDLRPFHIGQADVAKKLDDLVPDFLLQRNGSVGGIERAVGGIERAIQQCLL